MPEREIPEKDKPFYLAIIASGIVVGVIVAGVLGAFYGHSSVVEFAKEVFTPVFGLMSMAWAWYFKK